MVKKLFLVSCIGLLIGANLFAAVPKNTKLCNAVEKGKIEAVKKELTKNPEDINKKGDRHETPVTKAARIKDNTDHILRHGIFRYEFLSERSPCFLSPVFRLP